MTGEAAAQGNDNIERDARNAISWPSQLYLLIADPISGRAGEVLQICTIHWPPHIRHGRPGERWCQDLDRQGQRRRPAREPRRQAVPGTFELDEERLARIVAAATAEGYRRGRADEREERST